MKKSITIFALSAMLSVAAFAQEQPVPKKDTVNIDTEAKPTVYYDVEDSDSGSKKGNVGMIALIAGAVVVVGAVIVFVAKKKK